MKFPRSPYDEIEGLVYFLRMTDKIRLLAAGELPPDWQENCGKGFDLRCCKLLQVSYEGVKEQVLAGASDAEALAWCFENGVRPTEEQIEVWNGFMIKRGWRDVATETLERRKAESGLTDRADIATMFDYLDADEGRPVRSR